MSTSEASTSKRPAVYDVSAVLAMLDGPSDAASGSDLDTDDFGDGEEELSSESGNEVPTQLHTSTTHHMERSIGIAILCH